MGIFFARSTGIFYFTNQDRMTGEKAILEYL